MPDDVTAIYRSRRSLLAALLLAVALTLVGIAMVWFGTARLISHGLADSFSRRGLILPGGLIMVGYCTWFAIRQVRALAQSARPFLVVDDEGFTDLQPDVGVGDVSWSEVVDYTVGFERTYPAYLLVRVTDPRDVIERQETDRSRAHASTNLQTMGTPVVLDVRGIRSLGYLLLALDRHSGRVDDQAPAARPE